MSADKKLRIRALNDALRQFGRGGRIMMTAGVNALERADQSELLVKIRAYDDFTSDNDPHGEHDFGAVEHSDQMFFWKIDYYDQTMEAGSEDPSDPEQTMRILTIMLADEY